MQSRADVVAVVDPPNLRAICDSEPQRLTWVELAQRVTHIAQVLADRGVRPGEAVGVQLPNSCDLVATYLAITTIGAVVTPFPVQYRSFELSQMATLAHATAFVGISRIHDRHLDDIRADLLAVPDSMSHYRYAEGVYGSESAMAPRVGSTADDTASAVGL